MPNKAERVISSERLYCLYLLENLPELKALTQKKPGETAKSNKMVVNTIFKTQN